MLQSIHIENFKSIANQTIIFPEHIAVVMGRNGAGKSNLFQAVNLSRNLASGDTLTDAIKDIAAFPEALIKHGTDSQRKGIRIVLTMVPDPDHKEKSYIFEYKIIRASNSNQVIDTAAISYEKLEVHSLEGTKLIYEREMEQIKAMKQDEMQLLPIKVSVQKLALSVYDDDEVQKVSKLIDTIFVLPIVQRKTDIEIVNQASPNLASLDGVVVSLEKRSQKDYKEAVNLCKTLVEDFEAPILSNLNSKAKDSKEDDIPPRSYVTWSNKYSGSWLFKDSLSNGDLSILFMIFSLFNVAKGSTVFLEEVENGLHHTRIKKLVDKIRVIAANRNLQIIFTTHSIELLMDIAAKEAIFSYRDEKGESQYEVVTDTDQYSIIKKFIKEEISVGELFGKGYFK